MKFPVEKLKTITLASVVDRKQAQAFQPTAGDLLICTPSKCGTTMVQQIVQSLRTGGDLSFEEISLVIPFIELAHGYGYADLDLPQPGCIRAFKTHRWKPLVHFLDECKYIYVIRNPLDVSTSLFHFLEGWIFPEGAVQVDEFVDEVFLAASEPTSDSERPSIWHHMLSWFQVRMNPNVLWLFYEDLVTRKQACVKLIADFLCIPLNDQLLEVAISQSSKESMAANLSKYDDHPLKQNMNEAAGLPKDAGMQRHEGKVRSSAKVQLSESSAAAIRQRWREVVEPVTGCSSYEQFRSSTNVELGRPF